MTAVGVQEASSDLPYPAVGLYVSPSTSLPGLNSLVSVETAVDPAIFTDELRSLNTMALGLPLYESPVEDSQQLTLPFDSISEAPVPEISASVQTAIGDPGFRRAAGRFARYRRYGQRLYSR